MAKSSFVERNKAVREAWNKEQELVQEGKGTREWTPEQQRDILEKGRAYDDNGKAFEGQHMKSAEKYPEYQGDPGNIQFLTRAEHLEAHDGNWQNPTNWYFNPITKEKTDFGAGKCIPCDIVKLSELIIVLDTPQDKTIKISDKEEQKVPIASRKIPVDSTIKAAEKTPKVSFGKKIKSALKTCADTVIEFSTKHPTATKVIKGLEVATVTYLAVETVKGGSRSSSGGSYNLNNDYEDNYSPDTDDTETTEHASPKEHTVRGHGQHYHTKDGVIWKEKEPFYRGGKKNE